MRVIKEEKNIEKKDDKIYVTHVLVTEYSLTEFKKIATDVKNLSKTLKEIINNK